MTIRSTTARLLIGLAATLLFLPASADDARSPKAIPERPEKLEFPPLEFQVPKAGEYRHELPSGAVAYVVEDHTLPLVEIVLSLRGGSYQDPPDKVGLAELAGLLMRRGGTAERSAEELDEEIEFLAAEMQTFAGEARTSASTSCITPTLDACLDLFFEMVRRPGFEQERLELEKGRILEALRQRNDDAQRILSREWGWQIYGPESFLSRNITASELEGLTRENLLAFHRSTWRPESLTIAVSGDVETRDILERLEGYLSAWPEGGEANPWPPPVPDHEVRPGLYYVDKDIPQGKVYLGHRVPQVTDWQHPDVPALQVMNHILGAGGFTARIPKRVRSDEGLAYSAGSSLGLDPLWPGQFRVSFQSKSSTVALAAKISIEEIRRIQDKPVSEEEMSVAKSYLTDTFPRRFESAGQIAGTYVYDELVGRDPDYWQTWRQGISAVTAKDVQRVAREYLKPEDLVILIVGDWPAIAAGDADGRAKITDLTREEPRQLPLRDPLTLEPMPMEP